MLLLVCHKLLAPSRWIFLLDDKIFLPRLSRESDSEEKEEKHKTKHGNGDLEKPNRRWEEPRTELPQQGTFAHAPEAPSPNPSDRHTHGHAHPPHQHSHNPSPTSTSKEPEPNPTTSSSRALLNAIQGRALNRARRVRIFNFRPGTNSKLEKRFWSLQVYASIIYWIDWMYCSSHYWWMYFEKSHCWLSNERA